MLCLHRGLLAWVFITAQCLADDAPTVIDVTFTARCDQTEQKYALILPKAFQPDAEYDLLIALHGHGSDRMQYVKDPRDECRAARDVAAARGMIFLSPDYRAKTSWMGPKAEADVVQIIEDMKHNYRTRRVFLTGASMGGSASLTFAALHPDLIAGVASMNGTANHLEYGQFQEAIRDSFGGTKSDKPEEYKRRSAEYWPERFTMPTGITAGGHDKLVPAESVVRLAHVLEAMKAPVKLVYRETGGHDTKYDDARAILEFVIDQAE